MKIQPTRIPAVLLLTPQVHRDARGSFYEAWNARAFADAGLTADWGQDNIAESTRGVLRGLHCQVPQAQAKLVRCVTGEIFDVAVDVRTTSPTFGEWVDVRLSGDSQQALWVPAGFAHGYYVLSERAVIHYKVTDFYAPAHERILRWDDSDVGIEWPLVGGVPPILSARDARGASLSAAQAWFAE